MQDPLKSYVPEFKKEFLEDGEQYIQMQDLLEEFHSPSFVMDCKMGIRYYQQSKTSELLPRKSYWTPALAEVSYECGSVCNSRFQNWLFSFF